MYLVTGASGQFGRAVINHLLDTFKIPGNTIIAASRNPDKLEGLKARGITLRSADFDDEAGLENAFADVNRVLIISTDALDRPGHRLEQHLRAVKAADKARVAHVIYTSMPKPETSAVLFAPDHLGTEKALGASGLQGWTILRNNWYFENLLLAVPQALKTAKWYSAAGLGKIAHIARDDLARAAAAALISDKGGKTTYTLTGSKEYTTDEIASLVSGATGIPLSVVHVPVDGLIKGMVDAGLPAGLAKVFASFDTNTAQGGLSGVTNDYKKLTGLDPQPFENWLKANVKAFVA